MRTPAVIRPKEKIMQPRQDSNLDQAFRKRLFYPLNYGAVVAKIERPTFCGGKDATHL